MHYGAIVIGGGHNGLICAAYLAKAGIPTVVLEARDSVGGCASTVDALDARVNICNCDHVVFRTTPVIDELGLADHGLRYLDPDPSQVQTSWSGEAAWPIFHDVDRTLDALQLIHPDDQPRAVEAGGLSGAPLTERARAVVTFLAKRTELPILAVGGLMSRDDGQAMLDAGARLLQVYTGFVYAGPALVSELNRLVQHPPKEQDR